VIVLSALMEKILVVGAILCFHPVLMFEQPSKRLLQQKCQFATRSRPHALKMYWKRNQHRLRAHGIVTRSANAHGIPRNRLSL